MASRAQIAHIARRIEALKPSGPLQYIVMDPEETQEQALARHEEERGARVHGPVVFIVTGVPRSPDWGKW